MYTVMVTDTNGCSVLSSEYEFSTVGVFLQNEMPELKIFPNPVLSKINLEWEGAGYFDEFEVRIMDISGKEVLSEFFNQQPIASIDLGAIDPGMYFMHVKAKGKNRVVKIIKSR
jgi:hypothetical protein